MNNTQPNAGCLEEKSVNKTGEAVTQPSQVELDPTKAHIYNLIIVDESGSMHGLENATVGGINETIGTIKSAQSQFGDSQQHFLTLVLFDTRSGVEPIRTIINAMPIDDVQSFDAYSPGGCTPLYDAMGESLTRLHDRIRDDENATAVVTIITDGLENASRKWNSKQIKALVDELTGEGWSFTYMGSDHDARSVSRMLSISNVMEFAHDARSTSHLWRRDRSSKMAYYEKMECGFNSESSASQKREFMRSQASSYLKNRVTPRVVKALEPNEVFVFGSNADGQHIGGASLYALNHFGAIMGQAEGPQGLSYAIPTTGPRGLMAEAVDRFIDYAAAHPDQEFLVTPIGCGAAGYNPEDVAILFERAIDVENIHLPMAFWADLGLRFFL